MECAACARLPIALAQSTSLATIQRKGLNMRNAAIGRLALVLLAATVVIGGCEEGLLPTPAEPRPEKTKLTFWHIMNYEGPREVLQRAVDRFEAAHPNVDVEVVTFQNDPFKQKLAIEMAGGTPPDIFHTWGGGVLAAYARGGKLLDLTDALQRDAWKDTFNPTALSFCTFGDRTWAVPLDISVVPLWYNTQIFSQNNLKPPKTFAELTDTCLKLRAAGVIPLALGNQKQWPGAFYFIYLATRLGGTGLFEDVAAYKPGASFSDPAYIEAGRRLQELVALKAFPEGFNGIDDNQARAMFTRGKAAMYLMGNWLIARLRTEDPAFLEKLDCFPFPTIEGGKGAPGTMVGGTNAAFAVSATCRQPELAAELLRTLTAPDTVKDWITSANRLPASGGEAEQAALPAPAKHALKLLRTAPGIQLYYDQYLPPPVAQAHKETTQALFADTMTPDDAAKKMDAVAIENR